MDIKIDYKVAFGVMATLADVAMNSDYKEETRRDAQYTAYWFKQVIENYSDEWYLSNYSRRLQQESICYNRFGVRKVLASFGFDFAKDMSDKVAEIAAKF